MAKARRKKQHKKREQCVTCYKLASPGRKKCGGCTKKEWRKKYPKKASYQTLKYNSTRRKIFFDLTYEEFEELCYETNYMQGKGRSKMAYTVDREIEGKKPGYTRSNIQVIPKGINSSKEMARRKGKVLVYDWQTKSAIYIERVEAENTEDNPF